MVLRTSILLALLSSACATVEPNRGEAATSNRRIANLRRAAALPWLDDGRCAVQEASNEWPALAEACFHALDHDKIRFHDVTGKCTVAQVEAATLGVGLCILAAPEIVGAVIVIGVVVAAAAIVAELERAESCDDMFSACLGTSIAGIPGPLYGHSQCHACRDLCVQLGGAWPATANGKPCL
jgi:hypothetical protein